MSLFPAYGDGNGRRQGSSRSRGGGGGGDRRGEYNSGGSSSNPIVLNDDEEGEIRGGRRKRSRSPRERGRHNNEPGRDRKRSRGNDEHQYQQESYGNYGYGYNANAVPNPYYNQQGGGASRNPFDQGQGRGYNAGFNVFEEDRRRRNEREYNRRPEYDDRSRYEDFGARGGGGYNRGRDEGYGNYQNRDRGPGRGGREFDHGRAGGEASRSSFVLDTSAARQNLNYHGLPRVQRAEFTRNNDSIKVLGATDEELTQIYSKFSKFRCVLPEGWSIDTTPAEDEESGSKMNDSKPTSTTSIKLPRVEPLGFIGVQNEKTKRGENEKIDISSAFDSRSSFMKKEGETTMKEQIEDYNRRVRAEPRNISLWKEFIAFQDKYFDQNEQVFQTEEEEAGRKHSKKKKRRNKKALLEKKVAVVEKALESNPKCLDLHLLRLSFLYTLESPDKVLSEWKKLVTGNQSVTAYWWEYFRFAATHLQLYSAGKTSSVIMQSFQKLRKMLSPTFPSFQRPLKVLLVVNDFLTALALILRAAGFTEKAVSLHQAQLEADFHCPSKILTQSENLVEWVENRKMFELFWDLGMPKFGEAGAPGWASCVEDVEKWRGQKFDKVSVSHQKISEFEESFYDAIGKGIEPEFARDKSQYWLLIESSRSILRWLPWRRACSDVEEADDPNQIVLGEDISSAIFLVPKVDYITDFDRQSAHFRHVINFIVTIQEDFIPQTQTVTCLLNPFLPVTLTQSRSLTSEIFYWRKLLDLYAPLEEVAKHEEKEKEKPLLKIPEGFRLQDWTSPSGSAFKCDVGRQPTPFDLTCPPAAAAEMRSTLLAENEANLASVIRSVVDRGIDELSSSPFASIIFETWLRFEEKNTVSSRQGRKERLRIAKSILQKPCLRNSMGAYLELAMLEYYEGEKDNAISLLVKTINLGVATAFGDGAEVDVDLEKDWEMMAELTKLYVKLAEFHLLDKPQVAYHILCQLGSGFKPVNLEGTMDMTNKNALLKALRLYEKISNQLVPGFIESSENEEGTSSEIKTETVFPLSNEMLGRWDGDKVVDFLGQKTNILVEWVKAFALFRYLSKSGEDFSIASEIFEKVLSRVEVSSEGQMGMNGSYDSNILVRHHIREQLYISWCNLGAHVLSKNPMANSKFRTILGKALDEFPSSPPLLLLFTDVENQMSIAGKLWRAMMSVMKQEESGCNHWAPLLMGIGLAKKIEELAHDEEIGLGTFGLGGPAVPPDTIFYKLDSLLSAAEENRATRNCPLVWRTHLKLLALRSLQGKDISRARTLFYESVRHCPSSKSLYLDGISYFPETFGEITALMSEKGLYVRHHVEEMEILLQNEGEETNEATVTVSSDEENQ